MPCKIIQTCFLYTLGPDVNNEEKIQNETKRNESNSLTNENVPMRLSDTVQSIAIVLFTWVMSMPGTPQWRIQGEGQGGPDPPIKPDAYNFET